MLCNVCKILFQNNLECICYFCNKCICVECNEKYLKGLKYDNRMFYFNFYNCCYKCYIDQRYL